jgi:site-specific DNA-methyltransferase (adenine-specific)
MIYYPQGIVKCYKQNKRKSKGFEGSMERKSQSNNFPTLFTNFPKMAINFKNDTKTCHPTQKPVELCEYLIKTYTKEGEVVLDNCMGSGSIGVAALNTGRFFIGIEKNDHYFEVAKKRIEDLN